MQDLKQIYFVTNLGYEGVRETPALNAYRTFGGEGGGCRLGLFLDPTYILKELLVEFNSIHSELRSTTNMIVTCHSKRPSIPNCFHEDF